MTTPSIAPKLLVAALALASACGGSSSRKPQSTPSTVTASDGLVVTEVGKQQVMECARHDLAVRLMKGGAVRDEQLIAGECAGACTEAAKREGEAQVKEIEKRIAAGEASESELDYNFSECLFHGAALARWETVGTRRVALLAGHHAGAHDIPNAYYQLATEHCGKVWLSQELGATYANRWSATDLTIAGQGPDITVTAARDSQPIELYRVRFPTACPGAPEETVSDADATAAEAQPQN